jgi:hypothetical protein
MKTNNDDDCAAPASGEAVHGDTQMPSDNSAMSVVGVTLGGNVESGNIDCGSASDDIPPQFTGADHSIPPPPISGTPEGGVDPDPKREHDIHGVSMPTAEVPAVNDPPTDADAPEDVDDGLKVPPNGATSGTVVKPGYVVTPPEHLSAGQPPASRMKEVILKARKSSGAQLLRVRAQLTGVSVYKSPPKGPFYRVRHDDDPFCCNLLKIKGKFTTNYFMIVGDELASQLCDDRYFSNYIAQYRLALIVDCDGNYGWWAVPDLREDDWAESARDICARMESEWVRVEALEERYGALLAEDDLGEPVWPQVDDFTLLEKAFKDRVIIDLEHPVIKKLKGKKL